MLAFGAHFCLIIVILLPKLPQYTDFRFFFFYCMQWCVLFSQQNHIFGSLVIGQIGVILE